MANSVATGYPIFGLATTRMEKSRGMPAGNRVLVSIVSRALSAMSYAIVSFLWQRFWIIVTPMRSCCIPIPSTRSTISFSISCKIISATIGYKASITRKQIGQETEWILRGNRSVLHCWFTWSRRMLPFPRQIMIFTGNLFRLSLVKKRRRRAPLSTNR